MCFSHNSYNYTMWYRYIEIRSNIFYVDTVNIFNSESVEREIRRRTCRERLDIF